MHRGQWRRFVQRAMVSAPSHISMANRVILGPMARRTLSSQTLVHRWALEQGLHQATRSLGRVRLLSSESERKPASSPKIDALVEQIASLSLLEASELTEALKVWCTSHSVGLCTLNCSCLIARLLPARSMTSLLRVLGSRRPFTCLVTW